MLLFADNGRNTLRLVEGERLVRVLQQVLVLAGLRGRHRRRQMDQPLRIPRKPAHHLQRWDGVLFPDRDLWLETRVDQSLACHICEVQDVVVLLLERTVRHRLGRKERPRGFVVGSVRRDGDSLTLRIAKRRVVTTNDTACIDVGSNCLSTRHSGASTCEA